MSITFRPAGYSDSDINCFLAEVVYGWRWWSHNETIYGQRDRETGERAPDIEARVRSIRPPDFPNERWRQWGEKVDLRPADMTEPVYNPQGTGALMSLHMPPWFIGEWKDAIDLAKRLSLTIDFEPTRYTVRHNGKVVGRGRKSPRAVASAAVRILLEESDPTP